MSGGLTTAAIVAVIPRLAEGMESAANELNELDGALGDGDLGVTLVRGMRAIATDIASFPTDDVGLALLKCAQGFTKTSGSTFGTLVATGLMAAAKVTKGHGSVPWVEVPRLMETAQAAMANRGKADLGDKTALDALDGARRAMESHEDPNQMLTAAIDGVHASLERLRQHPARQGRARIFGDKTIGRDDPGMIAILRVLESLR